MPPNHQPHHTQHNNHHRQNSRLLLPPQSKEINAILSSLLSGFKYGVKIRLPHALVMTFLFRRDMTAFDKLKRVLGLTLEHSCNLAAFAGFYKTILALLKTTSRALNRSNDGGHWIGRFIVRLIVDGPYNTGGVRLVPRPPGIPERPYHSLLAGFVGGYVIWGRDTAVNYNIVLYLASRSLASLMTLARKKLIVFENNKNVEIRFAVWAGLVWSVVMYLFEECPDVLSGSLKSSMNEIYRDDDGGVVDGERQLQQSTRRRLSRAVSFLSSPLSTSFYSL